MLSISAFPILFAVTLPSLCYGQYGWAGPPGAGGWGENAANFPDCAINCAPAWDGTACNAASGGNWGQCLCSNGAAINTINTCVAASSCMDVDKDIVFETMNQLCRAAGVTLTAAQEATFTGAAATGTYLPYTGSGPYTSWWNERVNNNCPAATWTGWKSGNWNNNPPWTSWVSCTATTTTTHRTTRTRTYTTTNGNGNRVTSTSKTTSTSYGIRVAENTQGLGWGVRNTGPRETGVGGMGALAVAILGSVVIL